MLSKELVAASTKPLLLALLAERESYGYELIQRVKELSDEEIEWTEGMLYPVLHRLEEEGLIESEWRDAESGRQRRYYRLIKEVWAFHDNRIAVRFAYEWHDDSGHWFRSYGNENWEFDEHGYMRRREASINDVKIAESERRIHGPRAEGDTSGIPLH